MFIWLSYNIEKSAAEHPSKRAYILDVIAQYSYLIMPFFSHPVGMLCRLISYLNRVTEVYPQGSCRCGTFVEYLWRIIVFLKSVRLKSI
jgi:hypothetical protein